MIGPRSTPQPRHADNDFQHHPAEITNIETPVLHHQSMSNPTDDINLSYRSYSHGKQGPSMIGSPMTPSRTRSGATFRPETPELSNITPNPQTDCATFGTSIFTNLKYDTHVVNTKLPSMISNH